MQKTPLKMFDWILNTSPTFIAYILDERSYEIVFYALFPSGHFFVQYGFI